MDLDTPWSSTQIPMSIRFVLLEFKEDPFYKCLLTTLSSIFHVKSCAASFKKSVQFSWGGGLVHKCPSITWLRPPLQWKGEGEITKWVATVIVNLSIKHDMSSYKYFRHKVLLKKIKVSQPSKCQLWIFQEMSVNGKVSDP